MKRQSKHPARAAGRRIQAGLLIGAGCLLAAGCATGNAPGFAPRVDLARMQVAPAPRSTLVSRPEVKFHLARARAGASEITALVHDAPSGHAVPVAEIVAIPHERRDFISIRRLPASGSAQSADLDIAIVERLYVIAVGQDPQASYCFAPVGGTCDPVKHGESHAELLRELVDARQHALRAHEGHAGIPWHVVSMTTVPDDARDADRVAVRVTADQRALPGANIFFSRAPHSGCVAKSDAQGLATCELVDYHGDDGDGDEGAVPVVATFSGDVGANRVLVPTTFVLGPTRPERVAKEAK